MADVVRGVDLLQTELEKAKESLKDVDESIKKLTGRDPTIQRTITQRRVSLGSSDSRDSRGIERSESRGGAANRLFSLARRGIVQDGAQPRAKAGGAFARLGPRPGGGGMRDRGLVRRGRDSGDEDELPNRPTLQSSVIATPKEERTRNASLQEQARDRKGQARNRRMFGLLLGTLQKFKEDAAETKDKEEQRIKIEKKLDEKFKQEKEDIKKERRNLFIARKQKQFRIRLIEQKMEMVDNHEEWERETHKLNNFLRTRAKPHIFFMPKIPSEDLETKLQETEKAVEEMIVQRRKKLEEEIAQMMSQVHDANDDDDDDDEGGDDGENMDDDQHDDETRSRYPKREEREGHGDDKENDDDYVTERELRDKEREERDREKQMRDKAREERMKKRERNEGRENKGRSRSRDKSREKEEKGEESSGRERGRDKSGERERGRDKSRDRDRQRDKSGDKERGRDKSGDKERGRDKSGDKERGRDKSGDRVRAKSGDRERGRDRKRDRSDGKDRSRDRDRERHRSGKTRSDRHESKRDGEGDRSHKHSSKSKRRSKGEGKTERKEKVWEPMEDEEEEEFVGGSKDTDKSEKSLAAKMMEMAGMSLPSIEAESENVDKESESADERTEMPTNSVALEDIPRPPEDDRTIDQSNTDEPMT